MINRFSLCPVLLIVFATCAYGSTKNIILIGYPRSMSTVLERYFINRGDFDVCHEPIRIYVWEMSKGRSQGGNIKYADQALKNIHFKKRDKPYFIKDFAYFLADVQFMNELMQDDKVQIVFLIRDPEQAVISYYKTAVQSNMSNAFGYTLEEM